MRLQDAPSYREVLARPREDGPRVAVAAELRAADAVRARYIEVAIEETRRNAAAIQRADGWPETTALYKERRALLRAHGERWQSEDGNPDGTWMRGFLEGIRLEEQPEGRAVEALQGWPILHLSLGGAHQHLPAAIRAAIDRMVSVSLRGYDDEAVAGFLAAYDLSTLRKLTVNGPLTEKVMHAICEADLPMLEELAIEAPGLRDPCEAPATDDWAALINYARRSRFGEELEARYGWRKYLHAPSRFSTYPYLVEVLDILPALPDDQPVRSRRDG